MTDPALGPAVRLAFEVASRGFPTWHSLRHALAVEGLRTSDGRPLSISALGRLLRNPFYAGELRWKGESHPGAHEPIVDRHLFDRVQRVLATRKPRRPSRRREFLMRGLATCAECGAKMTGEAHGAFRYYRCLRRSARSDACKAPYCNVDRAHVALEGLYRRLRITPAMRRKVLAAVARAECEAGGPTLDMWRRPPREARVDARSLWEIHGQLSVSAQALLLVEVFAELALGRNGISLFRLKAPFSPFPNQ